jgi:phage gp36-like protein
VPVQTIERLQYVSAGDILTRMSERDLIGLTLDNENARAADREAIDEGIAFADGGIEPTSDVAKQIGTALRQALLLAEGRVNSRVGATYRLPATASDGTVPSEIADAVLTLAVYNLYARRPRIPAEMVESADRMEAWLREIAAGKAVISKLDKDGVSQDPERKRSQFGQVDFDGVAFSRAWY